MAVKVHCSVCDVFIKNVEPFELQKLTGKEICADCAKKIADTMKVLDTSQKEYLAQIEKLHKEAKSKYMKLDEIYNHFSAQAKDMLVRMRAELEDMIQRVLSKDSE